jgi:glycosyltransferase involved in cell wall biosynthesis
MNKATVLLATMQLDIGGAETHVVDLARYLTELGYRVLVASNGGCYVERLAAYGVPHYHVPLHDNKPGLIWQSVWAMRRIVRDEQVDLIHAHARIPAFVTAIMGRPKQVRFITTAHYNFKGLWYLSRWGEKTIAVSEDIRAYLIDYFRVSPERIVVIPNGVDTDLFSPGCAPGTRSSGRDAETVESGAAAGGAMSSATLLASVANRARSTGPGTAAGGRGSVPRPEGTRHGGHGAARIAMVSRMDGPLADVAVNLISACEQVYDRWPLQLLIAGDGDNLGPVSARAAAFNKRRGKTVVSLLGARTDINRILAASDLVVGVSRVAMEAMSCARPVILAGPQGFGGLLAPDRVSLFKEDNFTARGQSAAVTVPRLTDALEEFFAKPPEWRRSTGQFLRQLVIDEYSSLRMAERVAGVYDEVLANLRS